MADVNDDNADQIRAVELLQRHAHVGIAEVAKRANVSIATVSRVMSGSNRVNAEMTARVRGAVAELGYRPNRAAQGLASGRFGNVGVVMPDMSNPYFSLVMQAVAREAEVQDCQTLVADTRNRPAEELRLCEGLLRQVDGLLLIAPQMPINDLRTVARWKIPTVLVNRLELGVDLEMIAVDNFAAMLEMSHHLVQLGHRKAVYVAGPEVSWQNRERWRAVEHAKIFGLDATRVNTDGSLSGGYDAVAEALPLNPTALICFNDIVAAGVMAALRARGLDIPGDISVTGYDDSVLAAFMHPPLTTARSPIPELGEAAWSLLWSQIDPGAARQKTDLRAEVTLRSSTGPARSAPA